MEKIEKNAFEKKIEELKTKENGILIFEFSTNEAYVTYKGKSVQCLSATLLLKFNDCTFSNNYLNNIPDDNTLKNTIILIDTSKSHNIKVYLYDIQKDLGFEIRNKKNLELNDLFFLHADTANESIMILADYNADTLLPMVSLVSGISDAERNFLRKTSFTFSKWIKN